jgi:hypothetical protein
MASEIIPQTLSLTSDEVAVLSTILSDALGALHDEIYKTEDFDMRQSLKQREALLTGIQARLAS